MKTVLLVIICFTLITVNSCVEKGKKFFVYHAKATAEMNTPTKWVEGTDTLPYPLYYARIKTFNQLQDLYSIVDSAVGYNFNYGLDNPESDIGIKQFIYKHEGYIEPSAYNETILNQNQLKELLNILIDSTNTYSIYEQNETLSYYQGCYLPHVAFGLFSKDSLLCEVDLCFQCSVVETSPFSFPYKITTEGGGKIKWFCENIGLDIVD